MKKELRGPKVENVYIAVVREAGEEGEMVYNVYLVNDREEQIEQVLVTSKGYSTEDKELKTSTLRRLLGNIEAKSHELVEPIIEEVFGLNNEYWVSFWVGETLYDKKYIFLPESIKNENFSLIPVMNRSGVFIG